jgi:hypothetical protein
MVERVARGRALKLGVFAAYLALLAYGVALVARDLHLIVASPDQLALATVAVAGEGTTGAPPAPAPSANLAHPADPPAAVQPARPHGRKRAHP